MAFKRMKIPLWLIAIVIGIVAAVFLFRVPEVVGVCPPSQYFCPGVGCLSGADKCIAGATGGPSAVFSKEGFTMPCPSMKDCRGGTRTDGPCLMEF